MSDYLPHSVANVWVQDGDVHATFSHCARPAKFANVAEWMDDKVSSDMCTMCDGTSDEHFPGCPNEWRDSQE